MPFSLWRKAAPPPAPAPAVPSPAEIEQIAARTAAAVRAELADEIDAARELGRREGMIDAARALAAGSPVPAVPDAAQAPPHGAYAMDRPITFSTPQAPSRRPGSAVTVDTLRALADNYDILRSCINHLKREVLAVPLQVVPKDPKDARPKTKRRLKEAQALFSRNGAIGGPGTPRRHYEGRLIEDLCVVGAAAVYHQRGRGGQVLQSVEIDAATIRPYTDAYGWTPGFTGPGSDHAYEQWIYGVYAARFSRADLTYDGIYPTTYSPYFKSPVEYLIDAVDTALRSSMWNKGWLTDGTSPDEVYALPETWSPSNVREFAEWWDSIQAQPGARHKTRFVPGNTGRIGSRSRKDQDFSGLDLWTMRRTCSILGVQPASIGFVGEQYKVSQDASMDQTTQFGAGVLLMWRKDHYDELLEMHGYAEFEVVNVTGQQESAKARAETNEVLVRSGQRTINEVRQSDGEDPVEGGDVVLVPTTVTTLKAVAEGPPEPPEPGKDGPPGGKGDKPKPDDKDGPPEKTPGGPSGASDGGATDDDQTDEKAEDAD